MYKFITSTAIVLIIGAGGLIGYRLTESRIAVDIYRDRLHQLHEDYDALRLTYNEAIRKTAVTELIVEQGRLTVAIRTADGQERLIETPYDPAMEIYCDYVLLDGRLWIRQVYDGNTPPREGVLIDPMLAEVDWNAPGARYGNAVYRSLDEGRWIVTVTGDGSLGLTRSDSKVRTHLSPPPHVHDYEEIEKQIHQQIDAIGIGDVTRRVMRGQ